MQSTHELGDLVEMIVVGAVGLTARALAEASPGVDLTISQWRALVVVGTAEDGLRVGRVADRIGVTAPATGRLLRRLSRRGLVSLTTDEVDHRATIARLTSLAEEKRAAVVAYRRQALRSLASGIPRAEQVELARAASRIAAALAPYR